MLRVISAIVCIVVLQGCSETAETNKATQDSITNIEDHRKLFEDLIEETEIAKNERIKYLREKYKDKFQANNVTLEDQKHKIDQCVAIWSSYRVKAEAIVAEEGQLRGTIGDSLRLKQIQNCLKAKFQECKDTARKPGDKIDDAYADAARKKSLYRAKQHLAHKKSAITTRLHIGNQRRQASVEW
jgi:DNA repair ATPase RecN